MSYRCWTCSKSVEAQVIVRCAHPHCTAKRELEKDVKIEQQKKAERVESVWLPVVVSPGRVINVTVGGGSGGGGGGSGGNASGGGGGSTPWGISGGKGSNK